MKVFKNTKNLLSPHALTILMVLLMGATSAFAQVGAASTDLAAIDKNTSDVSKLIVTIIKTVVFAGCAVFFATNMYQALVSKKPGAMTNAIFIAVGAIMFGNIGLVLRWILPAGWFTGGGKSFLDYFL